MNERFTMRCRNAGCYMGAMDDGLICTECLGRGAVDVLAVTGIKSSCCKAPVITGGKGTTHYYICTVCSAPCDQSKERHKGYGV